MATSVLFVAHHFPPIWRAGVRRSFQFAKNLPELGYNPIVLTITEDDIEAGKYFQDVTMNDMLHHCVEIVRISTGEPRQFKKVLRKLRIFRFFWFFFYSLFWHSAAKLCLKVLKQVMNIFKLTLIIKYFQVNWLKYLMKY